MKPSKKVRTICIILLAALIIIPLFLYLRPRTLDSVLRLDKRNISSISVIGIFTEDSFDENGACWPIHRSFKISEDKADIDTIIELLRSTRYRYRLRSLFSPDSVGLGAFDGTISIHIRFDDGGYVAIHTSGITTFSFHDRDGFLIAATNNNLFDRLSGYIRNVGEES